VQWTHRRTSSYVCLPLQPKNKKKFLKIWAGIHNILFVTYE
jgi:hypothetical protein